MSNYQKILTSKRKMPGQAYYQPAFQLQNPLAWHTIGFKTPDRPPFGTTLYEGVFAPTPNIDGSRGTSTVAYGVNREFIGVAPVKGVFGGLT